MMDILEIREYLPQRYPFLLVDRITDVQNGKCITGYKNVTANEEFFNGHFPGKPVMPGVLILEAMAQAAALLSLASAGVEIDERTKREDARRARLRAGPVARLPGPPARARGWWSRGRPGAPACAARPGSRAGLRAAGWSSSGARTAVSMLSAPHRRS